MERGDGQRGKAGHSTKVKVMICVSIFENGPDQLIGADQLSSAIIMSMYRQVSGKYYVDVVKNSWNH